VESNTADTGGRNGTSACSKHSAATMTLLLLPTCCFSVPKWLTFKPVVPLHTDQHTHRRHSQPILLPCWPLRLPQ